MDWFGKIPKISSFLLIATYGVFGWLYGSWIAELANKTKLWFQWAEVPIALGISYGLGLLFIGSIAVFCNAPINLLTLGMSNWFRFNTRAIFAIATSVIVFALVIEYPAIFGRFLVLSSAAILFRLDLQTIGCSYRISQTILIVLGAIAFTTGMSLFIF